MGQSGIKEVILEMSRPSPRSSIVRSSRNVAKEDYEPYSRRQTSVFTPSDVQSFPSRNYIHEGPHYYSYGHYPL